MDEVIPNPGDEFSLVADVTYLNCASRGPLLRAACAAGERGVWRNAAPWDGAGRTGAAEEVERVRAAFAGLVGASAEDVALVPSTAYGIAVAAANLPLENGQNIVVIEEQFPSNFHAWRYRALETGAQLRVVPRPSDWDWSRAILEHIDSATAIVALAPCRWNDGSLVDLAPVAEAARERGAALVVDATQAAGAMPLDVARLQPDFLVAAGYKWLLCPYTSTFLYAHPRHHAGRPIEHYAWTHPQLPPEGSLRGDELDHPRGARRFDSGQRNNPVNPGMAAIALERILRWGPAGIARCIAPLTQAVAEAALERGFQVPPEARRVAHIIGLRREAGWPPELERRLQARGVYVSTRGDALRVSPYLFNEREDVTRLFQALDAELGTP